jgi:HK97 family phage prohead protease
MPWSVRKSSECPDSKPWACIKDDDGEVEGCHATREAAMKQQAALYAAENGRSAVSEILLRSDGTFTDVDRRQRLIDVIAVPWEQEAQVFWRGEMWTELFARGAFNGIEARAGQVRVNREHQKGNTVGKIVEFDSAHDDGLFARVKVVKGPVGDHVLDLAEDDLISASVGYRAQKPTDVRLDKQSKVRRVLNAFLDHLGMVEDPAFDGARVLAVREDESGLLVAEGPLPDTPTLDEFTSDPVLNWARDRLSL